MQHDRSSDDSEALRGASRAIAMSCAGFNLRRAARAVTQHFDHALAPHGLRTTQFTLLAAVALCGPVTTNALAQILVMDRTTLTRNVRVLREAGWVQTVRQRGGRELQFQLSATGRRTLASAIPTWREAQGGIEEAFGAATWPDLVGELGRLVVGTLLLTPGQEPPPGLMAAVTVRAAGHDGGPAPNGIDTNAEAAAPRRAGATDVVRPGP